MRKQWFFHSTFYLLSAALLVLTFCPRLWADPVADLRQVLKTCDRDLEERDRLVKSRMGELHNISDLHQGLMLREWLDQNVDEKLAAVDRLNRLALVQRFEESVRAVLRQGDQPNRLAVLNLILEMGVTRGVQTGKSMARDFGPDLAALVRESPPRVAEAAARVLGQINPEPTVAVPALAQILASREPAQRQVVAEALFNLMRVISELATPGRSGIEVEAGPADVVAMARAVVPVAVRGLHDSHAEVRLRSAKAIGQAVAILNRLLLDRHTRDAMMAVGIDHPDQERQQSELVPLIQIVNAQRGELIQASEDADPGVRLLARRALEDLADVDTHLPLLASAPATPPPGSSPGEPASPPGGVVQVGFSSPVEGPEGSGPQDWQNALPTLAAAVTDQDLRARLTAIDVLETLGPAAAPAAPALVRALADSNQFVRWAAARTLGKIGPVEALTAVPALGKLLADPELDVRLAAAATLERYGPDAQTTVPALIKALTSRETDMRVAATRTLATIGIPAQAAIPALTAALADPEPHVRKSAVEALDKLAARLPDIESAIHRVLNDPNPEVRKAAGEALLHVHP